MKISDVNNFDRREMEMVHTMLRRELGLVPELVRGATDIDRARVIADHFAFVADTLHHHHLSEDDYVWPLLAERSGQSADEDLRAMGEQHSELAARLEQVREGMHVWSVDWGSENHSALVEELLRFNELVGEHLRAEEDNVVPLMERHITAHEWDQMVQKGAAAADPATLPLGFGMLMYEGDPEVVERALSAMPAEARPVIRDVAANAYAEHAQRVYGTATPLRSTEV